jgi:hypothetical protein
MASISAQQFLANVKKCLTVTHLSDLPLPFVVINNKLYQNASKDQIFGILFADGTPMSVSRGFNSKMERYDYGTTHEKFFRMVEQQESAIKKIVLETVGASPPLTKKYTKQDYQDVFDSLFGPGGFFTAPKPLTPDEVEILGDLFKELLNRSKGISLGGGSSSPFGRFS